MVATGPLSSLAYRKSENQKVKVIEGGESVFHKHFFAQNNIF